MKNLSNVLVEVLDWNQLGINLDLKTYKLQEIAKNKQGEVGACRLAFIDLWLRSDVHASWERLVEALEKMDERAVVGRIREEFLQGGIAGSRAPRQGSCVAVAMGGTNTVCYCSRIGRCFLLPLSSILDLDTGRLSI